MLHPTRSARSRFVLLLLVASAVSLLTLDFRGFGPLETAQAAARGVVEPLAGAADTAVEPARNLWRGIVDYGDVKAENERLRREVAALRTDPTREQNAQQQLDILKAQLDIPTAANVDRRIARVVSGPVSNFENNVRIDKGAEDGLAVDMVVVTEAGLVGRIAEVTPTRSVVALLDSRDFGVNVRLAGTATPITFTLRGQGRGRPLAVQGEVPPGAPLTNGAALVTSGLGRSLFPPDIPVGQVVGLPERVAAGESAVTGSTAGSDVTVEPYADPANLSFVTVLLWQAAE